MSPRPLALVVLLSLTLSATGAAADEPAFLDDWGITGSGSGQWLSPERICVVPGPFVDERVVVVDRPSSRIQQYRLDGTFITEWTVAQNGLLDPVAVAWAPGYTQPDAEDRFLVLDAGADAVLVFDVDGNLVRTITVPNFEDGDVAYEEVNAQVHVVLTDRHVLETYSWPGGFLARHGTLDQPGDANDQLDSPLSLAASPGWSRLVIADTGNDRIVLLATTIPDTFGSTGTGPGQFIEPRAVAVDCRGRILVADTGNDRVQRLLTGATDILGVDEIWFAGVGGLSEIGDLGYGLDSITIVGKEAPAAAGAKRSLGGTDLFLLDTGLNVVRRYEGECCFGGFGDPPATATSAGGSLYITPAGTGPTLESAGATVTVEILDLCEEPIAGYPFQDIWLDDVGNGDIALCQGGSVADGNTNGEGRTTISGSIFGGGATDQGLYLYIAGLPVTDSTLNIRLNSPDITGDLKVDLADVGPFGLDYYAQAATLQSDFNHDGVLNLGDVGILGAHLGEECP